MKKAIVAALVVVGISGYLEARPPFCPPEKPCPTIYSPAGVATDPTGLAGSLFYAKFWQTAIMCYNGYSQIQPICSPEFKVDPNSSVNAYLDDFEPIGLTFSKSVPIAWFFSAPTGQMISCKWQNAAVQPVCSTPTKLGSGTNAENSLMLGRPVD